MKTSDLTWPPLRNATHSIPFPILADDNGVFLWMPLRRLIFLIEQICFSDYIESDGESFIFMCTQRDFRYSCEASSLRHRAFYSSIIICLSIERPSLENSGYCDRHNQMSMAYVTLP